MRLVPDGLAGRFATLLAAALVAANLAALVLLGLDRDRELREVRRGADLERIAALAVALGAVPPEGRAAVARALSSPALRLSVDPQPAVPEAGAGHGVVAALGAMLGEALDEAAPGEIRAAATMRRGPDRGPAPDPGPGPGLAVSVPLPQGGWLNALRPPGRDHRAGLRPGGPILLALGLGLVAVLGASLLMVRRITRPLTALARAADRAGRGDRDARAPVEGAAELRGASEAFNAMQAAIGAFEAERARVVAALGHDLRTPITSLRIRAEMLDDEAAREPMIRTLGEMEVMAHGLLRWGRGGAEAEEAGEVDLARLLREVAAEGDPDAPVRHEGPQSLLLRARPVALRRAFANLASNARRYAGGGVIRLSAADGLATVVVEDHGPGIPEDALTAVLEPFQRGEASRAADTGGAGLGLAIARDALRAHGGTLVLENREGGGLRATATLPMGDGHDGASGRGARAKTR